MASHTKAETIRSQVREMFTDIGVSSDAEFCESLLIRDGYFCGRRFEMDGLCAVWFVEENQLKIYDRDGKLLRANALESVQRRAAA